MRGLDSHVLLRAFCDELARCGLRHACTSPGSRCTPVTLALAREPRIRAWSHLDERCAGFFAVGAARASGLPVALACTSGTAAANLAPAVIEAHEAALPLIVLTADRPAELRDVGAGQTIDQVKLFGDAVKWFAEPDLALATPERLRSIRALACRAYWTALRGRPGPVHLNLPLREPLVPSGPVPDGGLDGRPEGRPWVADIRPTPGGGHAGLGEMPSLERAVIVAGTGVSTEAAVLLANFAERAGIPLLADPLSGARRGAAAIARYDHLLRDPGLSERLAPRFVFRFGELPTSKPLRQWLGGLDGALQFAFVEHERWPDPDGVLAGRVVGPIAPLLAALAEEAIEPAGGDWLASWQVADRAATEAIAPLVREDALSEPSVAALLGDALGPEATLFVAASMPVRDVEAFFDVRESPPRVLANRGANGIDGTVSAAFGAVAAGEGPVVLLIGDVALAYDVGGLLAGRRLGLDLTIVLLNNDGGGIFHFLPVAGEADAFEEHVATPHRLDFAHAAALYGCGYELVQDADALRRALASSLAAPGTQIIEVRTDRAENLALHRRIAAAASAALTSG